MSLRNSVMTRYATIEQCLAASQHQAVDAWLCAAEQHDLRRFRDVGRRRQWLAGRWLAKELLCQAIAVSDKSRFQILTRDSRGQRVRPTIVCDGRRLDGALSISHSSRALWVALDNSAAATLGVDLVESVPTTKSFFENWFSPGERRWIEHDREHRAATIWAVKETVYKAVNDGEAWDPREIEVLPENNTFACAYRGGALAGLALELQGIDRHVAALARWPRADTGSPLTSPDVVFAHENLSHCQT